MKAIRFVLIMVMIAVMLGFNAGPAEASWFAAYDSSILLQNLEGSAGKVTLYFYNQDGTIKHTQGPDDITANGSVVYFPLPAAVGSFSGSVVVSATVNVASVSVVRGNAGAATGQYIAQTSGSTSVALPILMKGNGGLLNNTWFNVQNVGLGDTNITVTYSDGTPPVVFNGLKKGASHTFDQALETHPVKAFAGTVASSAQPVVVTVIQENQKHIYASNGFPDGDVNPVMPLVNKQPAKLLQTGVNIKNTTGSSTNVTVTFTKEDGSSCTETQTLASQALGVFALTSLSSAPNPPSITSNCPKSGDFVGSAEVTTNSASSKLAVVVNQFKGSQAGSAYAGFAKANSTGKFVAPTIMDHNGKWNLWSSITVMNVGAVNTTVTCTFTGSGVTKTTASLVPGKSEVILINGVLSTSNVTPYVGGSTCTANSAGAKIIGTVGLTGSNTAADQMGTYEAINIP